MRKASGSGGFDWEMSKVVPYRGLGELVRVGKLIGVEDSKVLSCFDLSSNCV